MKTLSMILLFAGLIVLGVLLNSKFGPFLDPTRYALVEVHYPETNIVGVSIKKVRKSSCEEVLEDFKEKVSSWCSGCELTEQVCTDQLPGPYWGVFDNKWIGHAYIILNSEYPERHILVNMLPADFDDLCDMVKERYEDVYCRND